MKRWTLLLALVACSPFARADSRSSADYSITTEVLDSMGAAAASADYSAQGSAGGLAGISTSVYSTLRTGYLGQLYLPVGIAITASPDTVNEGDSRQLNSWRRMDDDTLEPLSESSLTWSVDSGPIDNVTTSGLAATENVFRDTSAVVRGNLGANSATFTLSVVNVGLDDFDTYAGDGLEDKWQVTYFGVGSSEAGPTKDVDGDGQNNLAEFLAGYSPTDISSYLKTDDLGVVTSNFRFRLSRVQPGTRYIFERSVDLVAWHEIVDLIPTAVAEPYVKALPTFGTKSFYRVRLQAP